MLTRVLFLVTLLMGLSSCDFSQHAAHDTEERPPSMFKVSNLNKIKLQSSNLVTNGDGSSGTAGWAGLAASGSSTATQWVAGTGCNTPYNFETSSSSSVSMTQSLSLSSGATYYVSCLAADASSPNQLSITIGGNTAFSTEVANAGGTTYSGVFVATSSVEVMTVAAYTDGSYVLCLSDISVTFSSSSPPSLTPTAQPTSRPSSRPSVQPSCQPSLCPSSQPICLPTAIPTCQPSSRPTTQPSVAPSCHPNPQPSFQPTIHPSEQPTGIPTGQPSIQPISAPIIQPSSHPSSNPTSNPTTQPGLSPSVQPTGVPSTIPSNHPGTPSSSPSKQPTSRPSHKPSAQPSSYPSAKPWSSPTTKPSSQPSVVPTITPTSGPTDWPSSRPFTQPSRIPSSQPSCKPTLIPSSQPSTCPSSQPHALPSAEPTTQPLFFPTVTPTSQPASVPSINPSTEPTRFPTNQPSSRPSNLPSALPTTRPTSQPTEAPSTQPTRLPTSRPSSIPSIQPSCLPSVEPSTVPSTQPSVLPTRQPTSNPSNQPSGFPSAQPSAVPSVQPSSIPTLKPSSQPSIVPTVQPTLRPTNQPSCIPSDQPSSLPSGQPSIFPSSVPSQVPSTQPSCIPTMIPSSQPYSVPTSQPSAWPSVQPSSMPTEQPASRPSSQPTNLPSTQPTSLPSSQPSSLPTSQPSGLPSGFPTTQPSSCPSSQPSVNPSGQPTSIPTISRFSCTAGKYYSPLNNSCPYCPPHSSTNISGELSCICLGGYVQIGFATTLNCTVCPSGEVSSPGAAECSKCAIGMYALPSPISQCEVCPQNFYNNQVGQAVCQACPSGFATGTTGTTSASACISPVPNFMFGTFSLVLVLVIFVRYIVYGQFHKLSFDRRMKTVIPNMEKCKRILCYEENQYYLRLEQKRRHPRKGFLSKPIWKIFTMILLSIVGMMFFIFFSYIGLIYKICFNSLILWRGLRLNFNLSPILNLLQEGLTDIADVIRIPNIFYYALSPFILFFQFLASINLNLSAVNVTCQGSEAPIELLANCCIIGILIVIVRSDYQLLFNLLISNANQTYFQNQLVSRLEDLNWNSWLDSNFAVSAAVLSVTVVDPFQVILRYVMGFVSITPFVQNHNIAHNISTFCDNVVSAPHFDSALGYSASVFAWWVILPAFYCLSEVVVAKTILSLRPIELEELKLQKRQTKIFPLQILPDEDDLEPGENEVRSSGKEITMNIDVESPSMKPSRSHLVTAHNNNNRRLEDVLKELSNVDEEHHQAAELLMKRIQSTNQATSSIPVPTKVNSISPALNTAEERALSFAKQTSTKAPLTKRKSLIRNRNSVVAKPIRFITRVYKGSELFLSFLLSIDEWIISIFVYWVNILHFLMIKDVIKHYHELEKEKEQEKQGEAAEKEQQKSVISNQTSHRRKALPSLFGDDKGRQHLIEDMDLMDEDLIASALAQLRKNDNEEIIPSKLPSYYHLCLEVRDELHYHYLLEPLASIAAFLGFGHWFTFIGRYYWKVVMNNYRIFFMACLGIWTPETVEAYDIIPKSKYLVPIAAFYHSTEEEEVKENNSSTSSFHPSKSFRMLSWKISSSGNISTKSNNPKLGSEKSPSLSKEMEPNNEKKTENEEREEKSNIQEQLPALMATMIGARVILLQFIPALVAFTTVVINLCSQPIFVTDPALTKYLTPLISVGKINYQLAVEREMKVLGLKEDDEVLTKEQVESKIDTKRSLYEDNVVEGKNNLLYNELEENNPIGQSSRVEKGKEYLLRHYSWRIAIRRIILLWTESRILALMSSLIVLILSFLLVIYSEELLMLVIILLLMLVPILFAKSLSILLALGKVLDIRDEDFQVIFCFCMGMKKTETKRTILPRIIKVEASPAVTVLPKLEDSVNKAELENSKEDTMIAAHIPSLPAGNISSRMQTKNNFTIDSDEDINKAHRNNSRLSFTSVSGDDEESFAINSNSNNIVPDSQDDERNTNQDLLKPVDAKFQRARILSASDVVEELNQLFGYSEEDDDDFKITDDEKDGKYRELSTDISDDFLISSEDDDFYNLEDDDDYYTLEDDNI